jgi:hypothetical protein
VSRFSASIVLSPLHRSEFQHARFNVALNHYNSTSLPFHPEFTYASGFTLSLRVGRFARFVADRGCFSNHDRDGFGGDLLTESKFVCESISRARRVAFTPSNSMLTAHDDR